MERGDRQSEVTSSSGASKASFSPQLPVLDGSQAGLVGGESLF